MKKLFKYVACGLCAAIVANPFANAYARHSKVGLDEINHKRQNMFASPYLPYMAYFPSPSEISVSSVDLKNVKTQYFFSSVDSKDDFLFSFLGVNKDGNAMEMACYKGGYIEIWMNYKDNATLGYTRNESGVDAIYLIDERDKQDPVVYVQTALDIDGPSEGAIGKYNRLKDRKNVRSALSEQEFRLYQTFFALTANIIFQGAKQRLIEDVNASPQLPETKNNLRGQEEVATP